MSNGQATVPPHRFLSFYGGINPPLTNNLRAWLATLVNEGASEITLLFASEGGSLSDGIALHAYLKSLPVKLNIHAVGWVASIAIPVFLAAENANRFASPNARFFIHGYNWTYAQGATLGHAATKEAAILLESAVSWSGEIIKASTQLTDKDFESMQLFREPCIIDPRRAAAVGLIAAIAEPKILAGSQPRVVG